MKKTVAELEKILPSKLKSNLNRAYKAHLELEKNEKDDKAEVILEQCDDVFYENEEEINNLLEQYADSIEL